MYFFWGKFITYQISTTTLRIGKLACSDEKMEPSNDVLSTQMADIANMFGPPPPLPLSLPIPLVAKKRDLTLINKYPDEEEDNDRIVYAETETRENDTERTTERFDFKQHIEFACLLFSADRDVVAAHPGISSVLVRMPSPRPKSNIQHPVHIKLMASEQALLDASVAYVNEKFPELFGYFVCELSKPLDICPCSGTCQLVTPVEGVLKSSSRLSTHAWCLLLLSNGY